MSSNWTEIPLGELVSHKKGFAFKSQDFTKDGGRRVIRVSDTNATSIKTEDPVFLPEQKAKSHSDYELSYGDIILTTVGSRPPLYDSMVGKTIRVPKEIEGALLNQNMVKLSPKEGLIDPGFLYAVLKTKRFITHIEGSARGNANQASITLEDTFQFPVLVPPLAEQRKIAEILSCWDEAIRIQRDLIQSTKRLKSRVLCQAFQSLSHSDASAVKVSYLGDIASLITKGTTPTTLGFQFVSSGINFVKVESISDEGSFDKGYFAFIDEETHQKLSRSILKEGDILCSIAGALGRITQVDESILPANINQALAIIRFDDESLVLRSYVRYFLCSDFVQSKITSWRVQSAQPNISLGDLKGLTILIPDLEVQKLIADTCLMLDKQLIQLKLLFHSLKLQKQALMQQLLTGKIRVKTDLPDQNGTETELASYG